MSGAELSSGGGKATTLGTIGRGASRTKPGRVTRVTRPVVRRECLCNEVIDLYRATTGNATPKGAIKAHSEEACPLGVNFSQVGKWAEWLRVNPEAAPMVCSPLIYTKGQSGYTDM